MASTTLGGCTQRASICARRRVASLQPVVGPNFAPCRTIHARRCDIAAAISRGNGRGGSPGDMDFHEAKLGPNVLASVKDLRTGGVKWGTATVVRNDAQSLDGGVRVLHLAVEDHVDRLYGRRLRGVPDATRWIESYTIPGQCVGVRLPPSARPPLPQTSQQQQQQQQQPPAEEAPQQPSQSPQQPPRRLYSIACSPYASRRDSAYVDASLIEVVVERGAADPEEAALAELGPGAQLEVTQVIGRGFSSLLDSYNGLTHALEEGRNLVLVSCGSRGMAALRSCLTWQPVLAHASGHRVAALVLARCAGRAAFVAEWDSWREAGMQLRPLYTHPGAELDDAAVMVGATPAAAALAAPAGAGGGDDGTQPQQQPAGSPAAAAAATAATVGDKGAATTANNSGGSSSEVSDMDTDLCLELLQRALFLHEGGFEALCGGPPSRTSFLLAGLPRDLASGLAKLLSGRGVAYEHILFAQADFF